ncbi:MFS transporter [Helicobacter sp. MIT 00-7814]|uniref:MFS transporter n=1 Tax=unclassified Helicobacter TaxID=2593540 RepID=UPI000E1FA3E5|nr:MULTISPECIES: MFS transporter [unclassified Helicobacter]RDU55240.1 MFS transporter [Helicobacter sp. MIT 99-10781]RDU56078.1 MFS transporter [Helicobacter sp. MIT 00-7814]
MKQNLFSKQRKRTPAFILYTLSFGVFAVISSLLGIMGLVPLIAQKFNISSAQASSIVSIFALIVTIAAPIMPLLCARIKPRVLFIFALSVFSITSFFSIFTNDFGTLFVLRIVPAVFHPIFIANALSVAGDLSVDKTKSAKFVSLVFLGISAGMVLGVSLATFLGAQYGFEVAMGFFFVLNLIALVNVLFFVPDLQLHIQAESAPVKENYFNLLKVQLSIFKSPVSWTSLIGTVCLMAAMYGFYNFLSTFLHESAGLTFSIISFLLFVYGGANIIGNFLAGRLLSKNAYLVIMLVPLLMMMAFAGIFIFELHMVLMGALLFILGILAGITHNSAQFMLSVPFPQAKILANGLYVSSSNLGISLGVALCGIVIVFIDTALKAHVASVSALFNNAVESICFVSIFLLVCAIVSIYMREKFLLH